MIDVKIVRQVLPSRDIGEELKKWVSIIQRAWNAKILNIIPVKTHSPLNEDGFIIVYDVPDKKSKPRPNRNPRIGF